MFGFETGEYCETRPFIIDCGPETGEECSEMLSVYRPFSHLRRQGEAVRNDKTVLVKVRESSSARSVRSVFITPGRLLSYVGKGLGGQPAAVQGRIYYA